jgi:hypothetical protein
MEEIIKGSFNMYIDIETKQVLINLLLDDDIPSRILGKKKFGNPKDWLFFLFNVNKRKFKEEK